MSGTTGEPLCSSATPAEEGTYLELVYCVRPAGASDFGAPQRLCVTEAAYVGRRDQGQWFFPDIALPETDTQTSRFHGVFVAHREPLLALTYHDLGSENGSSLAGEPIAQCTVTAGMCLRLGRNAGRSELRVVAVNPIRPAPTTFWPEARYGSLRGESAPLRQTFAGIDALVQRARASPVVVVRGPSGSGKKAVMWELLRRWDGQITGRLPYFDGRWLSSEPDPRPLASLLEVAAPVVVLDKLHGLSRQQQGELYRWISGRLRARSSTAPQHLVLLLEHRGPGYPEPELRDRDLAKLLRSVPTVRLPSALTCGREEIRRFAQHFFRQYQDDAPAGCRFHVRDCELTEEALARLEEEPWPGNWRQLQVTVEMAAFAVALDGRTRIEATDLQLGYGELGLPLEVLFEMPLASAEEIFRRTYLLWKFRKWAGNLSWVAHEADFSKRGLLKTAKEIGLHDGDQIVLPHNEPWGLCHPQRRRDDLRLHMGLPSAAGWLKLVAHRGGDVEAARETLLELLRRLPATTVESGLARQVRLDECDPARLVRSLERRG